MLKEALVTYKALCALYVNSEYEGVCCDAKQLLKVKAAITVLFRKLDIPYTFSQLISKEGFYYSFTTPGKCDSSIIVNGRTFFGKVSDIENSESLPASPDDSGSYGLDYFGITYLYIDAMYYQESMCMYENYEEFNIFAFSLLSYESKKSSVSEIMDQVRDMIDCDIESFNIDNEDEASELTELYLSYAREGIALLNAIDDNLTFEEAKKELFLEETECIHSFIFEDYSPFFNGDESAVWEHAANIVDFIKLTLMTDEEQNRFCCLKFEHLKEMRDFFKKNRDHEWKPLFDACIDSLDTMFTNPKFPSFWNKEQDSLFFVSLNIPEANDPTVYLFSHLRLDFRLTVALMDYIYQKMYS